MTHYTLRELKEAYMLDSSDSDVEDLLCAKYVEIAEDREEAAGRRRGKSAVSGHLIT